MISGHKICELVSQEVLPGEHEIELDVSNLPDGVYFVRMQTAGSTAVQKLVVAH